MSPGEPGPAAKAVRKLPLCIAFAVVLLAPASAVGAGPVRPAGETGPLKEGEVLSNETTLSRFAHAVRRAPIRTSPRPSSKAISRLRYETEDGIIEPYLVLGAARTGGRAWIQLRVPGRPNGRKGWVRQGDLGPLHVVRHQLVIDKGDFEATLYKRGERVWSASIGHGSPSTPTPSGRYIVRERLRSLGGTYGPYAFGTSAYSILSDWPGGGVIGIHGTDQPSLIPGRPSHGCVRIRNAKIIRLARLMPVGTPLLIK